MGNVFNSKYSSFTEEKYNLNFAEYELTYYFALSTF